MTYAIYTYDHNMNRHLLAYGFNKPMAERTAYNLTMAGYPAVYEEYEK
jgi:phage replication-related protein YjqB (UPF0714/DUF867 family)